MSYEKHYVSYFLTHRLNLKFKFIDQTLMPISESKFFEIEEPNFIN